MHGFRAMCLLRSCRCVFLAPQYAASRCPWMSALVLPVVCVPSCSRGPPCVYVYIHLCGLEMPVDECPCIARGSCPFLFPWSALCLCLLHICTCTTNLYYSTVGTLKTTTTTNESRSIFHLIYRIRRGANQAHMP